MDDLNCNGLNATECLLRVTAKILEQLKEDSNEFNWDPASFVVTLVIGIIAAVFAFFAIIQGFMAAGPGRHKCSKYAIGTWASLSKRKFDWSELRYRSVARTPVISILDLVDKMTISLMRDEISFIKWKENDSEYWDQDQLFPNLKNVAKEASDYFPATWLRLLSHTGLHHPELWETNPQGTDYLPSDLAAAPAYSTVNDLISIASIAAGKIQFNSIGQDVASEASIQGEYINLNFRSHPLLGVYAAIDQAIPSENDLFNSFRMGTYNRLPAHSLYVKLAYSQGFLPSVPHLQRNWKDDLDLINLFLYDGQNREDSFGYLIDNIYISKCGCPTAVSTRGSTGQEHRGLMFEWCQARGLKRRNYDTDPLRLSEGDISILAAAVPLTEINLFPKKLLQTGDKFIFLVLLSRRCMNAGVTMSEDINLDGKVILATKIAPRGETGVKGHSLPAFTANKLVWKHAYTYTAVMGRTGQLHPNSSIFDTSKFLGSNTIQKEIHRIDKWIEENRQHDLMVCRIMTLTFTTAMCKQMYQGEKRVRMWPIECDITREDRCNIDEMINDKGVFIPNSFRAVTDLISLQVQRMREYERNRQPREPSVDEYFTNSYEEYDSGVALHDFDGHFRFLEYMELVTKLWQKRGDNFKYPKEQVQHYLDDLLVYRATLIYMWLSEAADNSHILSNPEYHKLIPVI